MAVLVLVEKAEFSPAAALGTARALPAYSRKTSESGPAAVKVMIKGATPNLLALGQEMASALRRAQALAESGDLSAARNDLDQLGNDSTAKAMRQRFNL